MIETADDRSNQGIWQEMLGQTGQNAKLLAGWASKWHRDAPAVNGVPYAVYLKKRLP